MRVVCKNCNREFSKNYKYCPYCGQAATTERLNFHHLTHDIVHAFIHADKGVVLLFKELTYKPGRVARLYVEGKRKKYFNPFSFLVLMVAIALVFILKFESYAFLTWLFFRKYNLNYIENLVLTAYIDGQMMFFNCILLILASLFTSMMAVMGIVTGILMLCWSVVAILQFYETRSFPNIVKAIFLIVISQSLSQGLIYLTFDIYKKLTQ